ncbi:hypothetical protein EJP69_07405 [Variovorax gossypii]|uniref:HdeA/HdeB family protein n=1 Tax=Variovorax gossypii TaxID=1679495 RepID=A0A3S0QDH7_9BURK|nr:hypothetical protein [Variovorax gossypii]RTQ37541.1 hypothetical protein EJP69_07405 [Variovorax gossypii]
MRLPVLAVLVACAATSLAAAAKDDLIYFHGLGAEGCDKHIAWRRNKDIVYEDGIVQWSWGFISAFNNVARIQTPNKALPPTKVLAYLDKYCRDHPLEPIYGGVEDLITELGGRR